MVSIDNAKLETPLHEACREGHLQVLQLLLETDPWIPYMLNSNNETAFYAACSRGHLKVVKHLLKQPQFLVSEEASPSTSLHVAASMGYPDVVHEILKVRPGFASKLDSQGVSPLHLASSKGRLRVIRELLSIDSHLCLLRDNHGRTPLHLAAIEGHVHILNEFLSRDLDSAFLLTKRGETILHLSVTNNRYKVVRYLVENITSVDFVNLPDNYGNSVLHLATERRFSKMVKYLISSAKVYVNALNSSGFTALDILFETTINASDDLQLREMLVSVGGKRNSKLTPRSRPSSQSPKIVSRRLQRMNEMDQLSSSKRIPGSPANSSFRYSKDQIELHNELCTTLTALNRRHVQDSDEDDKKSACESQTQLAQVQESTKLSPKKSNSTEPTSSTENFVESSEVLNHRENQNEGGQNAGKEIRLLLILISAAAAIFTGIYIAKCVIMQQFGRITVSRVALLAIGAVSMGFFLIRQRLAALTGTS